jgi:DnaK suppressor protein
LTKPAPKAAKKAAPAVAPKPAKGAAPAAKKAAAKVAVKPAGKPAAKPISKPIAKSTGKSSSKPAAKVAPKTAPPAPAKSAPKTVATTVAKTSPPPTTNKVPVAAPKPAPAPSTQPATSTAVNPASTAKPSAAPAPAPKAPPPPKTPSTRAGKGGKAALPVQVMAPASPELSAHRFSDRFGPAKTSVKTHPEPMDLVKHAAKADPKLVNAWKNKAGRDLTEPELMAMPEREYMNEKQIDFFRARLQVQKDDLLSNAGETTEHLREDTSIVPDPADRATIEEEHALELRTRDRERKLLKKISQALIRLDSGEYGYCDETGEPIGLPRLLARPTATLSLEAQQRRELKQKMFGD